jgi:hypothetical protein
VVIVAVEKTLFRHHDCPSSLGADHPVWLHKRDSRP